MGSLYLPNPSPSWNRHNPRHSNNRHILSGPVLIICAIILIIVSNHYSYKWIKGILKIGEEFHNKIINYYFLYDDTPMRRTKRGVTPDIGKSRFGLIPNNENLFLGSNRTFNGLVNGLFGGNAQLVSQVLMRPGFFNGIAMDIINNQNAMINNQNAMNLNQINNGNVRNFKGGKMALNLNNNNGNFNNNRNNVDMNQKGNGDSNIPINTYNVNRDVIDYPDDENDEFLNKK